MEYDKLNNFNNNISHSEIQLAANHIPIQKRLFNAKII
jgi:hypothetical protein